MAPISIDIQLQCLLELIAFRAVDCMVASCGFLLLKKMARYGPFITS